MANRRGWTGLTTSPGLPVPWRAFWQHFIASIRSGGPPAGQHNFHRGGRLAVYDDETHAALSALAGRIDTDTAEDMWTRALASRWQAAPVWVHGDIASSDLLVERGKLCGVIDFGSSAIGDPASDLVIAWTEFSGESRQAFRDALALDEDTWARGRGWAH